MLCMRSDRWVLCACCLVPGGRFRDMVCEGLHKTLFPTVNVFGICGSVSWSRLDGFLVCLLSLHTILGGSYGLRVPLSYSRGIFVCVCVFVGLWVCVCRSQRGPEGIGANGMGTVRGGE